MGEGHRRDEYEEMRHHPTAAIGERWQIPPDKAGRGAKILTRQKRWSYDLRFHAHRRTSKKFKWRNQRRGR